MAVSDTKTSTRLRAVLVTARSSGGHPATGLQVVIDALETLIPEVEALEQAQPTDAVSPFDELRRRREELRADMQRGVKDFKTGLAQTLRDAADALSNE